METALHLAVSLTHFKMIELLLEQRCGPALLNIKDNRKRTPLDLARQMGQRAVVSMLESYLAV